MINVQMLSAPRLILTVLQMSQSIWIMVIKEIIELTEKIYANPHGCYRKIRCREKNCF